MVYKWLRRYTEGGDAALADRSSRPIRMPQPHQRPGRAEGARRPASSQARRRRAPAEPELNPSTVGRILARHQVPHLSAIDPITGEAVRSSRRSANRYEHRTPGAMVHVDVKKLGRIPSGGRWRLHGRDAAVSITNRHEKTKSATTTSTPPSMTTPGWPTAKCYPTKRPDLRWVSAPRIGLVRRPRRACAAAIDRQRHWSTGAAPTGAGSVRPGSSNAASPNPAVPGPTAKPNASTAPCSPNGPTPDPGPVQPPPSHAALTNSFAATTLDEATPPSAVDHHQPTRCLTTTCQVTTTRRSVPIPSFAVK